MENNSPSQFDGLLEEARESVSKEKFDKASRRWIIAICLLLIGTLLLTVDYFFYPDFHFRNPLERFSQWIYVILVGTAIDGVMAALFALIPFNKNWKWEMRFQRSFHFIYTFTLLCFFALPIAVRYGLI